MSMQPAAQTSALKSMTGYAQARAEHDGWAMRVSLRSVNHRFLDLRLRLPEGFEAVEPVVRQVLRDRVRRGHIDVTLHFEPVGPAAVQVNAQLAEAYLRAAEELRRKFALSAEPDLVAVLRLPGVVAAAGAPNGAGSDELQERLAARVSACLLEALERLEEMRRQEGAQLAVEMQRRLDSIADHARRVEALAERMRPAYARRLESRLQELLGNTPLDPARLAQEAALLAERGDVSEEIARLRSHVDQFRKLLAGAGEVGKKLDFLLQEMHREANTILPRRASWRESCCTARPTRFSPRRPAWKRKAWS